MPDDLMGGINWTDSELQAAIQLLQSNVVKLKEFLSDLVKFFSEPSLANFSSYVAHSLGIFLLVLGM